MTNNLNPIPITFKASDREREMLNALAARWQRSRSDVLRLVIRASYEAVNARIEMEKIRNDKRNQ